MTLSTKIEVFYGFYVCSLWAFIHTAAVRSLCVSWAFLFCLFTHFVSFQGNVESSSLVMCHLCHRRGAHDENDVLDHVSKMLKKVGQSPDTSIVVVVSMCAVRRIGR